jgi:hypothetical protein
MGSKASCIRPKISPTHSLRHSQDEDESTRSSGFGDVGVVVTNIVPHDGHPGVLGSDLPLQGQTAIFVSSAVKPTACILDWRSLKPTRAGEGFFLSVTGIDLSSPLGRCLPELIEDACSGLGKKSKVMEWEPRLAIWLYTRELSKADWKVIERKTVVPILRMRMAGLADDQIAKALQPGFFRKAVMAGDVEFRGSALACNLRPPKLFECVQSCVTQFVESGLYHLAALMLQQNWEEAAPGGQAAETLWERLAGTEQLLRDRLGEDPEWGDVDEPRDLEFHRLKSLFCTLLCATDAYDPLQAGHIVIADLGRMTSGNIRNYQEMVMSALLDLVDTVEKGERLKDSLIGSLDAPANGRVEAWLVPLDHRIAVLKEEEWL